MIGYVLEDELGAAVPRTKRAEPVDDLLEDEYDEAEPEPTSHFTAVTTHALGAGWTIERLMDNRVSDWYARS